VTIPALGPRGEGWAVAQLGLVLLIVIAGLSGPEWSAAASFLRWVIGISVAAAGCVLIISGIVGLGRSLTPFPQPSERSTLRVSGVYRVVRHPIYGGSILVALGWSLLSSPLALFATAFLAVFFELKSRREESLLLARFPEYVDYRRRVRWRFVPGVR
jgi:protein-S-isoprenylcysteine O-methyltransferase Ste14